MTSSFDISKLSKGRYWKAYTAQNGFTQWLYHTEVGKDLRILLPAEITEIPVSPGHSLKFAVCEMVKNAQGEYVDYKVIHAARSLQGAYRHFQRVRNGKPSKYPQKASKEL